MKKDSPKNIDEYIVQFPKDIRGILEKIRNIIRKSAPEAVEVISYQMPAFKYNGKILIYFAAFKNHIGVYPPPPEKFKKELAKYSGPKGNLKFPFSEPIPYDVIAQIVEYRVKEYGEK